MSNTHYLCSSTPCPWNAGKGNLECTYLISLGGDEMCSMGGSLNISKIQVGLLVNYFISFWVRLSNEYRGL